MTGITLQHFNNYFTKQYPSLVKIAKRIDNQFNDDNNVVHQYNYKDALHNAYIRISTRLENNVFNGNISGYTSVVIRNIIIDQKKEEKRKHYGINTIKENHLIETILAEREEDIRSSNEYQDQIKEITRQIFNYLQSRYNDKEIKIYRTYTTTKGSTYNKIGKMTGYSKSFVGEIVKKIKVDLKHNFIDYIKSNNNQLY